MKNLAIANRYASALYAEAKEDGVLKQVADELNSLGKLLETSKEFSLLVNTPALTVDEKLTVIGALSKTLKLNKLVYAFLVVLVKKSRLSILADIIEAMRKRLLQDNNELEVEVSYAVDIDAKVKTSLKERLDKITGKKVILKESIDPTLLGGLRVVIGSTLYDASVRGKLDSLKTQLSK